MLVSFSLTSLKMGAKFFIISSPSLTFTEIGPITFPEIDPKLFFLPDFFALHH